MVDLGRFKVQESLSRVEVQVFGGRHLTTDTRRTYGADYLNQELVE